MMKNLIYILVFACTLSNLFGQNDTAKTKLDSKYESKFALAKAETRKGNHKESIKLYRDILSKYPDFTEAWLRMGNVYYNTGQHETAIENFNKAITIEPEYDPEMYFTLGLIYKDVKKYTEASESFQKYLDRQTTDSIRISKAQDYKSTSDFRAWAYQNPVPFKPEKLSDNVNTKYSEYTPGLTIDGSLLVFTRRISGQEDLYASRISNGVYGPAFPITELNTHRNEGAHCVSADGKMIIFTSCDRSDSYGGCDLYYATYENGKWSAPMNMGKRINTSAYESQPSLSADGRTLYFTSNRTGSVGGKDLWMSTKDEKNFWDKPVNLGPGINTVGNDETAFIHPDGHTLYFRSDGRPGMGDYDIYYTRWSQATNEWTEPKNIGYPINTENSEGALSVSLNGKTAYFASDMAYAHNAPNANLDIYQFELYESARPMASTYIQGQISDASTGNFLKASVTITDLESGNVIYKTLSEKDGTFVTGLAIGKNYACIVEKEGYLFYSRHFELMGIHTPGDPFVMNIRLIPIINTDTTVVPSEPVLLDNIFFESGSAVLKKESYTEIRKLYDLLVNQPNLKIKILGHTDDVGREDDNLLLSTHRAQAVHKAIADLGIDKSRLSSEGLGEKYPVATNETAEGRKKNRRTEFVIVR
ncbi:MAG: PD40 domain-containing protein [Saprospiraceae bacterium]|nr:PD40 domain-containing protein [Saprospiraceae bacterium]